MKLKFRATVVAAVVLTAGEAYVTFADGKLPATQWIPVPVRLALMAALPALAWYFRWKAGKDGERG